MDCTFHLPLNNHKVENLPAMNQTGRLSVYCIKVISSLHACVPGVLVVCEKMEMEIIECYEQDRPMAMVSVINLRCFFLMSFYVFQCLKLDVQLD